MVTPFNAPDTSYLILHVFCACIMFFFICAAIIIDRRSEQRSLAHIHGTYGWYLMVLLSDCAFAIYEQTGCVAIWLGYTINIVWFLSNLFGAFCWFEYSESESGISLTKHKGLFVTTLACVVLTSVFVLSTPFTRLIFSIDAEGHYHRGNLYTVYAALMYLLLLFSSIRNFIRFSKAISIQEKKRNGLFAFYPIPIIIFSLVQFLSGYSFNCIGIIVSSVIVCAYIFSASSSNYRQTLNSLTDDFEAAFIVNVDTDAITPIRTKAVYRQRFKRIEYEPLYSKRILYGVKNNIIPEDRKRVLKEFDKEYVYSILQERPKCYCTYQIQTPEGENYYYKAKFVRLSKGVGRYFILAIGNSDEEEREKQLQNERLEIALQKADAANEAKSTFLFNMSHDIRTPLNAIRGFTELAKMHISEEEKLIEYLYKIDRSGSHLLELIDEVLDMSRIEAGKLRSALTPVNTTERITSTSEIYNEIAAKKGVHFEFSIDSLKHNDVLSDELHVNQILMNVISNAVKYTPEGGTVSFNVHEITSRKQGYAYYSFTIKDTGIGMSPEFKEKIFDAFARERTSTVEGIQGTGLGMAIVKKLIDFLGGEISIDSKEGVGTCVEIVLPFKLASETAKKRAAAATATSISLTGKKALVVEDNELNREIICELLKDEGAETETAINGKIACDLVGEADPAYYDFILMDIQMPVMDGYEAAEIIRKLPGCKDIPIVALSANAFEEDKRKSINCGMNAHLAKPIDFNELKKILNILLD